jgi:hypothetical protein
MRPDNRAHLAATARQRSQLTRRRAEEAVRQLDRAGRPVTFVSVAREASVSRSWLYRQPQLRAEINKLRTSIPAAIPIPTAQRASIESSRRRREAMLDEIHRLKAENRELRAEVARRLGHERAARANTHE